MSLFETGWWHPRSWRPERYRIVIYARTKDWPSHCVWIIPGTYDGEDW